MKIVVMGDALVASSTLKEAALSLYPEATVEIFEWYSDLTKDKFQERIKDIELHGPETQYIPDGIVAALNTADMFMLHYGPVSNAMISNMKPGALIGVCRGGLENISLDTCKEHGVKVIHVIRNADPVAEFTVGLMLAETRNIVRANEAIHKGEWRKTFINDPYKTTLSRNVIGLVGLGYIGKLVVNKLSGFGATIIAYDPFVKQESLTNLKAPVTLVSLDELLKTADIISLHARVTEDTMNLISEREIQLMKKNAYIINSARPGLLKKDALVDALMSQKIAGAALDVTWEEPIANDDVLLKLDNLTLTTHIAGDTVDAITKSPFLLADVIKEYIERGYSDMLVV